MTLLVVLGVHLGLIAWIVAGSSASTVSAVGADPPLELVFLPPVKFPQALADIAHPKHVNVNVGSSLVPPSLDSDSPSLPAPVSQNGGGGAGVNWSAEAHRAVKAFEIRRDEHVIHSALGTSAWDGWPSPGEHHAGDKYRTESGDWVVWIDSNCYQIASWREGTPVREETPPQTICINSGQRATRSGGGGEARQRARRRPPLSPAWLAPVFVVGASFSWVQGRRHSCSRRSPRCGSLISTGS